MWGVLDPLRRLGFQSSSCSVWAWKNTLGQFHQQTLLSSPQEKLCFIFARKPKDYPGDTETWSPSHVLTFCGSLWPRLSPLTSWYPSKSKKCWIRRLYHPNSRTSNFFFKNLLFFLFFSVEKKNHRWWFCTDHRKSLVSSCGFRATWWQPLPLTSALSEEYFFAYPKLYVPSLLLKRELQPAQTFYSQQGHRETVGVSYVDLVQLGLVRANTTACPMPCTDFPLRVEYCFTQGSVSYTHTVRRLRGTKSMGLGAESLLYA